MRPEDLHNLIEGLVIKADERFATRMARIEIQLHSAMVGILKELELTPEGFIKQNAANRRILQRAQDTFDSFMRDSAYESELSRYLRTIGHIEALNTSYFKTIVSGFTPNRNFIKALKANTIKNINTQLLQDGFVSQVRAPLMEVLNKNINQGGSFSGMLEQVRAYVRGTDEVDGRLLSYSRGILRDVLFQFSRGFQQAVTVDLGLVWYKYVGGIIDTTREFCRERNGEYWHKSEIHAWANLDWAGKNRLTTESSIFTLLGGYNCNHQVIPVHDSVVPKEVRERVQ